MDDKTLTAAFNGENVTEEVTNLVEAEAEVDVADLEDAAVEVAEEEVEEEVEEEEPEIKPEEVEDLLPKDHKERSDLGRKVAALLKKTDRTDEVLLQLASVIERIAPKEEDPEDDTYVTKRELKEVIERPTVEASRYEEDFKKTFWKLSEVDELSEEEAEAVAKITIEKYNVPFTNDPKIDGAMNYAKAKADYFKSKEKKLPIKKCKAPGVISKQVSEKKVALKPKLDQAAESFYNFIARTDGQDEAKKRLKSL